MRSHLGVCRDGALEDLVDAKHLDMQMHRLPPRRVANADFGVADLSARPGMRSTSFAPKAFL